MESMTKRKYDWERIIYAAEQNNFGNIICIAKEFEPAKHKKYYDAIIRHLVTVMRTRFGDI